MWTLWQPSLDQDPHCVRMLIPDRHWNQCWSKTLARGTLILDFTTFPPPHPLRLTSNKLAPAPKSDRLRRGRVEASDHWAVSIPFQIPILSCYLEFRIPVTLSFVSGLDSDLIGTADLDQKWQDKTLPQKRKKGRNFMFGEPEPPL